MKTYFLSAWEMLAVEQALLHCKGNSGFEETSLRALIEKWEQAKSCRIIYPEENK